MLIAGALGVGLGLKMAGDGVNSAGNGGMKIAGAVALAGAAFWMIKRRGAA
jgi:hypothetical protein